MSPSSSAFKPASDDLIFALIGLKEPGSKSKELSPKSVFIAYIEAEHQRSTDGRPLQWTDIKLDEDSQGAHVRVCRLAHAAFKQSVVLVDTQAFESKIQEPTVMSSLEAWLKETYPAKKGKAATEVIHFAGILYFCSIQDSLFGPGSNARPTRTLYNYHSKTYYEALCGKDSAKKICLITGTWDKLDIITLQEAQEAENRIVNEHWAEMNALGSRMESLKTDSCGAILKQAVQIANNETLVSEQNVFSVGADDIIIACMGPTGSGKTNFIDKLGDHHCIDEQKNEAPSGRGQLTSDTNKITAYRLRNHQIMMDRIVVVDTPGFDDTHLSDSSVLEMLERWLSKTYRKKTLLTGVLYFHRITDNRMSGTANRHIRMFGKLCGSKAAEKVVLVTTMWDLIARQDGEKQVQALVRLESLKTQYWKGLLDNRARTEEFDGKPVTAMKIIGMFFADEDRTSLRFQQEIVDIGLPLKQTEAGILLSDSLVDRKEVLEGEIKEYKRQAGHLHGKALEDLLAEHKAAEEDLRRITEILRELKVSPLAKLAQIVRFKKAPGKPLDLGAPIRSK